MTNKFSCLIQLQNKNGSAIRTFQTNDLSRNLIPKNTLDELTLALMDKHVHKIIVTKIIDYIEGDLF